MDNQIKSTSLLLVTHALWRATRNSVNRIKSTQQGKTKIVFFETSRSASLCRNSGRRQSCAQMGRDRPREGSQVGFVRPQSNENTVPFDALADIPTRHKNTELMRISRWPSRSLSKSKTAVRLRLHSTGSNIMVRAEVWRTTEGNNKAVVMVEFVVDTLVIWTPRTANCPLRKYKLLGSGSLVKPPIQFTNSGTFHKLYCSLYTHGTKLHVLFCCLRLHCLAESCSASDPGHLSSTPQVLLLSRDALTATDSGLLPVWR